MDPVIVLGYFCVSHGVSVIAAWIMGCGKPHLLFRVFITLHLSSLEVYNNPLSMSLIQYRTYIVFWRNELLFITELHPIVSIMNMMLL